MLDTGQNRLVSLPCTLASSLAQNDTVGSRGDLNLEGDLILYIGESLVAAKFWASDIHDYKITEERFGEFNWTR